MIFVTLGSQKFQFDRLLKALDQLVKAGDITDEIFAQIGYSEYEPKYFSFSRFVDREEYGKCMDGSDIVITHGGTGAIVGAVKKGKKVIAVPRSKDYGEHVDNHQFQITGTFAERNMICMCTDCSKLSAVIKEAREKTFEPYVSNTETIINSIRKELLS